MFYYTVLLNDNQAICLPSGLSGQRREATAVATNYQTHTFPLERQRFLLCYHLLLLPPFTPTLKVPHIVPQLGLTIHRRPLYASTSCLPYSVTSHNLLLPLHFYQIQV